MLDELITDANVVASSKDTKGATQQHHAHGNGNNMEMGTAHGFRTAQQRTSDQATLYDTWRPNQYV